ncbi:hypothetical protein EYZ11_012320 [Aspergillus tanneri]|uniref:Uncharacterized protein n=1 Tax=Aspergillus tanneri TaxID=1220188 RepID=A0A4S3J0J6_9EURO|nr:hypothetical protein EYZ11_012320 [Aspergillus tanneri]
MRGGHNLRVVDV